MTIRLVTAGILVLFGIAVAMSDRRPAAETTAKKSATLPSRQIEVLEETSEYRRIRHPLGETTSPKSPQRIACLTSAATDALLALGIRPVLVESEQRGSCEGPPAFLADRLQGVPTVRRVGTLINLETVLNAKPDLIFAHTAQDGRLREKLNQIAPTIYLDTSGNGNRNSLRERFILDVGDVVGMSDPASRRLAEHVQYLHRAQEALAATLSQDQRTTAFLYFRRHTCAIAAQTTQFGPLMYQQLGLVPDPAIPPNAKPGGWDVLSLERLSLLQAKQLFVILDKDGEHYFHEVVRSPIWQSLPGSQRVHCISPSAWIAGDGLLANEAIVHDVLAAMSDPPSSNSSDSTTDHSP